MRIIRTWKTLLVTATLTVPTMVMGGTIVNSKHDLSSGSTGGAHSDTQTQLCVFCHVPHNSDPAVARPLWSHTMTTQSLSWNPGKTVRGTDLPTDIEGDALAGSRACMSCHDGTIALGDLLNGTGGVVSGDATNVVDGKLVAGPNYLNPLAMETTHPLGVQQPVAKTGFTGFKNVTPGNAVNYDAAGYVQCGSCHNPHDPQYPPFLKIDNAGSAICITCHDV